MAAESTDARVIEPMSADDEAALFAGEAFEQDAKTEAEKPEAPEDGSRQRDERGRFSSQEPKPQEGQGASAPAAEQTAEDDPRHSIPLHVHLADRDKRQAAERRAEEAERRIADFERRERERQAEREAPQSPDIFTDPEGYQRFTSQQFQSQLSNLAFEMAMSNAQERHGDRFDKALEAVASLSRQGDTSVAERIRASGTRAGAELMKWYGEQEVRQSVGSDINAYNTRIQKEHRDALMKDPEFRKEFMASIRAEAGGGQTGQSRQAVILPSVNAAQTAARGGNGEDEVPTSEEELFAQASARQRRR